MISSGPKLTVFTRLELRSYIDSLVAVIALDGQNAVASTVIFQRVPDLLVVA